MACSCGKEVRFAEVSEDSVAEVGEFLQARAAPSKKVSRRLRPLAVALAKGCVVQLISRWHGARKAARQGQR
jgi:hypothetical protein